MDGERLGAYQIGRELGSGGMGKVYAATGPEGAVALKVVHPHLLETPGFFKRFMREAQLGQSIRHENVVRTLDCDQEFAEGKPQCFLVMEYVEGQTLGELLTELERVPEELCRHVAREICKGLTAIHDAGVVHRDLKPENVLITPDHVVKVMDLGVARLTDEALRLSKSGAFVGSVEYAAPEQFKGGDVDGRTDLHALGLLLYELSSGAHPYRGGSFHEVLGRVCDEDPRRLGDVNPQLSAFFEEVVHTLLVKDPRGRFSSATQLLDVLQDGEDSKWWHERARSLQATTERPIRRIRIPRETAVYGRDKELTKLRELYDRAKPGDGQVVLIEGEAGIGKSRLVDELIARLHADGEGLNFLFGSYPPGGAATAAGGFSSAYREQFGEPGSAPYLSQTPLLVPGFDAVLRGETAPEGSQPLTKDALGTCFVHATRNLAAECPTVVLIDDLHFAPEEARTLFTAIAQAVPGHRVLLIGTMRPGVSDDWIANVTRLDQVSRLDVIRLGPKDLIELLRDSFASSDLADRLGAQIAVKSDGNPFFAFEIIRGLREGQFITQKDDGTWVSTQIIDEIQIPSSVLELVNARVSDLTEDERNLLDVACCWGFEFDPVVVGDVLGMARIPLLRSLGQIERRHRLVRASGRKYVFDHHQVQEALYGSLSELLREEYHGALAEALESRNHATDKDPEELDGALCVDLCEHFLKGARGGEALRYLDSVQKHLKAGYLHAQVVALTERALAVPNLLRGVERAKALLRLASALDSMGRRARQEECAREAEDLAEEAGDEALRCRATYALGRVFYRTARLGDAEIAYRRALDVAVSCGDKKAEAAATGTLGAVFDSLGRIPEAQNYFERSLALSCELGDRIGEAGSRGNLGALAWSRGRHSEAQSHHEQHLALSRASGDRLGEATAIGNLGVVSYSLGRLLEAQEYDERHLALSRELGDRAGEARATGNLAVVQRRLGRRSEGRESLERAVVLCREIGDRNGELRATGNLGNADLASGRLLDAYERAERAHRLSREIGDRRSEAAVTMNLGVVLYGLGRLTEAREHHVRSLALSREVGYRENDASVYYNLGAVLRDQGDEEGSEEQLLECLEVCEEIGYRVGAAATHLALGSLRACRSRVDGGDDARGHESLLAARDLAAAVGIFGTETLARCELALFASEDTADALAAFAEHDDRLMAAERREARLLLWLATGDRTHLKEAKRLLDESLAAVPEEYHESMLTNVRINRETMAAWRAEFGEGDDGREDDTPSSESVTKAGLT